MSEQKIQELLRRKEFIVGYKDFDENGINQLDEKSGYYQIFLIYQFIRLFQDKSVYKSKPYLDGVLLSKPDLYGVLLNICGKFSEIEQRINNIQNKLVLAKIYDFKSSFVLCDKEKTRESIEAFKISANYFVDFILEHEIHESSCYDLITGVINLFKHKYFNQLEESIISKLDDCISKLYTANKICYLHCCEAASLTDRQYKDKINQLLYPLISNFDNEILALDKFFLSILIKTYPNLFNITLDHLRLIKTDLVNNNPDAYQIIKTIASKLPNTTTGLIEFKAEVENDIAECQKYLFKHVINNSITIESPEIQECINNISKSINEYQSMVNLDLNNKNAPVEKICYLLE
ncbi:MAG: hypothetical protein K2Y14_12640 [Burkholderiales bacterium]|nr:hypothetical protein [Burkholderiales bacterium]